MSSDSSLQYYSIESVELLTLRDTLNELEEMKYKENGGSIEYYRWGCRKWLQMMKLSVAHYKAKDDETVIKLLNMADSICKNDNPELKDENGKDFTQVLITLKESCFVDDCFECNYQDIQWSYNDFWEFSVKIADWSLTLKKSE